MTKEEKWGLAFITIFLVILAAAAHLLFPHSLTEAFLALYLFASLFIALLLPVGLRVQWQKNLIFRVKWERWLSSLIWSKPQNALVPLVEVLVLILNWPASLVVITVQLQANKTADRQSLKAQESSLTDGVGSLYYYAVVNCVGALFVTWIALHQPLSAPLKAISFVLLASVMLRHALWLISPGGAMAWIRRQRYNPFVSYTVFTLFDLASLTLITAASDFWFSGRPITATALRSSATALYKGPKDLVSSLFPGTSLGPSQMFHAPFHQQLILIAGVLFYASIIRALSSNVFKRTDADLVTLSNVYLAKGSYERTLACLSDLSHISAVSEMSRARAQLATGKILEARASVRRSLNLDVNFVFDPTLTDTYFGLFALTNFVRHSATQLWSAALQTDISDAMLFEMLLEEYVASARESEQQPAVLKQAFAQRPLLTAGACCIEGDPNACLAALGSATPKDEGEQFVSDALACWSNLNLLQKEEDILAYLQSWMDQRADQFRLHAAVMMNGRVWERSLAGNMSGLLEPHFRKFNMTAAQFVEDMRVEAMKAVNEAVPDYQLMHSFLNGKATGPV